MPTCSGRCCARITGHEPTVRGLAPSVHGPAKTSGDGRHVVDGHTCVATSPESIDPGYAPFDPMQRWQRFAVPDGGTIPMPWAHGRKPPPSNRNPAKVDRDQTRRQSDSVSFDGPARRDPVVTTRSVSLRPTPEQHWHCPRPAMAHASVRIALIERLEHERC